MTGRSIRIYLVDGDASGLLTAEVMNWSGKFLVAPRTMLKELAKREEITRTGVYVLAGPDPENPSQDMIYVGEGDNVFKRIAAHDKDVDKEFWVRCVAVISKDLNLTKGHVRYLESGLSKKVMRPEEPGWLTALHLHCLLCQNQISRIWRASYHT